jgi:hypothetical protein
MQNQLKKEDFTQEELEKCENDPVYFYNKYVRLFDSNGDEIPKKEVTQEEYDAIMRESNRMRNGLPPSWKMRRNLQYPYIPSEMFIKPKQ